MAQEKPQFKIEDNVLIGKEVGGFQECRNVGEPVLEKLKSKPDFVGEILAATGEQRTFAEIRERSVKCALWLKKQGIHPGDIIGICTDNNLDTSTCVFGTLFVAAIVSGWDHEMSIQSARFFLSLICPKLVFVNAATAANVAQAAKEEKIQVKIVVIGKMEGFESLEDILESIPTSEVEDFKCTPIKSCEDVAMICWSSGTTGLPKGTNLSHRSVMNCITPIEDVNIIDEISMWTPPIRWHYGLALIMEAVLSNSRKVIAPDTDDDDLILGFIEKYGVTYFTCDPCLPIRWCKFGLIEKYKLDSLKKVVVSGAHFNAESQKYVKQRMPHVHVLQCFGITDAGGLCISQSKNSKPGSIGFVCKNIQLKIVDTETGMALGPNKTGELCMKSPSIMNGYYKNPDATEKAFDSEGWLRTSDMGYYDEDGEIFLVDRISEFINYRSIKLSPAEIEAVLETHPAVLKAAVVPIPHEIDEEHPMAFVTKVPGKQVTAEELTQLVEKTLPWYCKLLGGVKFMQRLPRTTTGKIAKKQLKEIAKGFAVNTITS